MDASRQTRPRRPIEVVGAAIVRGGDVLAARRGRGKALEGMWEFPGGKIEANETPQAALVREIREELHCEIEVGAHVATTSYTYEFGTISLSTYVARLKDSSPIAMEHAELRWIAVRDLLSLEWAPADIHTVLELIARSDR